MFQITIKANAVRNNGNGTFTVDMNGRTVSQEEAKLLEALFPHLVEGAYELLNKEALLASIAKPSDVSIGDPDEVKDVVPQPKKHQKY